MATSTCFREWWDRRLNNYEGQGAGIISRFQSICTHAYLQLLHFCPFLSLLSVYKKGKQTVGPVKKRYVKFENFRRGQAPFQ